MMGFERSLGVLLNSQLKQDAVYSEVRKYPDSITRTLDAERTPVAVFDTLVAQTNSTCQRCAATFGCAPSCSASPIWTTTTSNRRS